MNTLIFNSLTVTMAVFGSTLLMILLIAFIIGTVVGGWKWGLRYDIRVLLGLTRLTISTLSFVERRGKWLEGR